MKLPEMLAAHDADGPIGYSGWSFFEKARMQDAGLIERGKLTDRGKRILAAVQSQPWFDFVETLTDQDRAGITLDAQLEVADWIARGGAPLEGGGAHASPEQICRRCVIRQGIAWIYLSREWPGTLPPLADGEDTLLWAKLGPVDPTALYATTHRIEAGDVWVPVLAPTHPAGLKYTMREAGC